MTNNKHSKQSIVKRFKIIEGHFRKIIEMVQNDVYCIDILQQTTAVKNAMKSAEAALLENHLRVCVIRDVKKGKKKAIDELLALFRKINK